MSKHKEIIIFIGPPGSGKGSLAQLCVKQLGWAQLSTGFLCRKYSMQPTQLGQQVDFLIKSGKLISDDLIIAMVEEWMIEGGAEYSHIILDGFPRTPNQALAFSRFIEQKMPLSRVYIRRLIISDDKVIARLSMRFICKNKDCQTVYSKVDFPQYASASTFVCEKCSSAVERRADDESQTVQKRLKVHYEHEKHLLDFFIENGKNVACIDADRPLPDVFEDFKKTIGM